MPSTSPTEAQGKSKSAQRVAPGSRLRKPSARSRVTNGRELLPSADGRSTWARLFTDTYYAMLEHLGGPDFVSEARRMIVRRIAVLEVELIHWEDELAKVRMEGSAPDPFEVDNYVRWSSAQRRHLEALGLDRTARPLESLSTVFAEIAAERKAKVVDDAEVIE